MTTTNETLSFIAIESLKANVNARTAAAIKVMSLYRLEPNNLLYKDAVVEKANMTVVAKYLSEQTSQQAILAALVAQYEGGNNETVG